MKVLFKFINPLSAACYVLCNAAALFFIYKKISASLGLETFGIWSLFLTLNVSFALFYSGFNGALARFLPQFQTLKQTDKQNQLITFSLQSILGISVLVLFLFWTLDYIFHWSHQLSEPNADVQTELPYILGFVLFFNGSSAFHSIFEGFGKGFLKNVLLTLYSLSLFFVFFFASEITFTYLCRGYFYLSAGLFVLSLATFALFFNRYNLSFKSIEKKNLTEVFHYGMHFSFANVFGFLQEPIAKGIFLYFLGGAEVGLFEMASKFVVQARMFLVAIFFSIIPKISQKVAQGTYDALAYKKLFSINLFMSIASFFAAGIFLPVLSLLWFGKLNSEFLLIGYSLLAAWFLNNLCLPAYCINAAGLGISRNTISSGIIVISFLAVSALSALLNFPHFVIHAWGIGLALGGLYLVFDFAQKHHLKNTSLFEFKDLASIGIGIALLFLPTFFAPSPFMFFWSKCLSIGIGYSIVFLFLQRNVLLSLLGKK